MVSKELGRSEEYFSLQIILEDDPLLQSLPSFKCYKQSLIVCNLVTIIVVLLCRRY